MQVLLGWLPMESEFDVATGTEGTTGGGGLNFYVKVIEGVRD